MTIEILIITHRVSHLKVCLEHILKFKNNILIIVNGYDKSILNYLENIVKVNANVRFVVLQESVIKSRARNIGIEKTNSDIIYFIDDDAYFNTDNLKILSEKIIQYPDVSVFGGPNITPEGSSLFQRLSGYILTSTFTAWKMRKRYSVGSEDEYCDDKMLILCNLAIKKELFAKEKIYFNDNLVYNEENLLLEQFKKLGYKMLYVPALKVFHDRREKVSGFARQIFKSGEGRAIMSFILPESLMLVHILPSLFVLYLIGLLFYNPVWLRMPFYLYLTLNVLNSLYLKFEKRENVISVIYLFIMSIIAHVSYGVGFLFGVIWKRKV